MTSPDQAGVSNVAQAAFTNTQMSAHRVREQHEAAKQRYDN